jgi:hypothetical protein
MAEKTTDGSGRRLRVFVVTHSALGRPGGTEPFLAGAQVREDELDDVDRLLELGAIKPLTSTTEVTVTVAG